MRCDERYFEWMNQSIDGELGQAEQARLEAHLSQCEDCRAVYAALARMAEETRGMEAEVPAGLNDKILSAVRAEAPRKTTGRPAKIMRWIVTAGGAAALLAMVIFTTRIWGGANSTMELMISGGQEVADAAPAAENMAGEDDQGVSDDKAWSDAENVLGSAWEKADVEEDGRGETTSSAPEPQPNTTPKEPNAGEDTNGAPAGKGDDYRYVLVFTEMPEALDDYAFETADDGSRHYDVSNALAESLLDSSQSYAENENQAKVSLVIVEN